jgi:hypothetical protein
MESRTTDISVLYKDIKYLSKKDYEKIVEVIEKDIRRGKDLGTSTYLFMHRAICCIQNGVCTDADQGREKAACYP